MKTREERLADARAVLAFYDENEDEYAEISAQNGGYVNGRDYENYEDTKLDIADRLAHVVRQILEAS